MFLFQETYYATPGQQALMDSRVRSLHQAQATQPSSVASDWLKYLGDGVTYLALRLWQARDYTVDSGHMQWMAEYNRTRPADLFMQPPDIEFFEPVSHHGTPGAAGCCVRTELEPAGRHRAAWAVWEQALKRQMTGAGGFREYRLYQFLGRESRLFRAEFWETPAAAEAFWRDEARKALWAELPADAWRKAPIPAYYQVLLQLGNPAAA
jgi:hypothetical protein